MAQQAEPLTILVVRSGGFAGLRRAWRVRAEGADASAWVALVDACPWDTPPTDDTRTGAGTAAHAAVDRLSWEVTAAGSAALRHPSDQRVVLAESEVAGPWRDLIDAVRAGGEPCAADTA